MATNTKLKLKKSSVAGRIPSASDLDYGELAINYQDGKLYYKNAGNNVRAFLDSGQTISLIDSDYVTARVGDVGLDSAAITNLVDSDYVAARSDTSIGAANTVVLNTFTGDSSTTDFVLTNAPTTEQHAFVTINGIDQHTSAYTLSGATLSLSEAPIQGDAIEVRTLRVQTGKVSLRDYTDFIYQPSSSTTVFSGSDINGDILAYDVGKMEVYLNGSKLVDGLDFTATNGTSITLQGTAADSGDTIAVTSLGAARITEHDASKAFTTTDSDQVITTFNKTTYRTAKYIVQMSQNSRYHSQEVLLVHDGTTVNMVEYADIYTESDLGTLDADISGDAVRLLVTPNYANTTVKVNRTEIKV